MMKKTSTISTTTTSTTTTICSTTTEDAPAGRFDDPTRSATEIVLALGGNVGPTRQVFTAALGMLARFLSEIETAPLYLSHPHSPIRQADYLNTVVVARTRCPPEDLLAITKLVEWRAGRRRGPRSGPRALDIDLLIYAGVENDRPELRLPHPRLADRRFVLQPLFDLRPDLRPHDGGVSVRELLALLDVAGDQPSLTCVGAGDWHRQGEAAASASLA